MIASIDELNIQEIGCRCLSLSIEHLNATQDELGRWLGANRSYYAVWYAVGLALDGEPRDSPVILDIFNFVEKCANSDGGLGPYPGEPSHVEATLIFTQFLKWVNPNSKVLAKAQRYLRLRGQCYRDPWISMAAWVFDPQARDAISKDKGPPAWLRKLTFRMQKRGHITQFWDLTKLFPNTHIRKPGLKDLIFGPITYRAFGYPLPELLEESVNHCAVLTGFDESVLMYASLRKLANDTSSGAQKLYDYAMSRLSRFVYPDGSTEWMSLTIAYLFFARTFHLDAEYEKTKRWLRSLKYLGDGWIQGDILNPHVWETALLVVSLINAGISPDDKVVRKATDYLRASQTPSDSGWSWAFYPAMGDMRPYTDTDDYGAVLMALDSCGLKPRDDLEKTLAGLESLQENSGAFSTYGGGNPRPNWAWLSNTSRAMQGLVALGRTLKDASVHNAAEWLLNQQLPNGSWIDGWCCRYVYGTVMALEGLLKAGRLNRGDVQVERAVSWLLSMQNPDGGWGETWSGTRSASTCEHTGLALYGLELACLPERRPLEQVRAGLAWLAQNQRPDGTWESAYFMNYGLGIAGAVSNCTMIWGISGLASGLKMLRTNTAP